MLTLFYSPHMTSIDNEAGRASGHADVALSPLGRQQAEQLGQHYATETLGVRALAEHLGKKYRFPASFVNAPTGL